MWSDFINNPEFIRKIYKVVPDLIGVKIHEVKLHRDGPRLSVRLETTELPTFPPKKWAASTFNVVQVTLDFWGISELTITGCGTSNISNVSMSKESHRDISISIVGNEMKVDFLCNFIRIEKIEPFLTEIG